MSCTANPRYTEYWPIVVAAWLKLGITPVCLFIPDNPNVKLPKAPGGIVHTIPPLNDVHITIQGLMLRFWGSYLYPNAIVATGDIDAVPLSKHFFQEQLAPYPDHAYVHLKHAAGAYHFYGMDNIPEKSTSLEKVRYTASWFNIAKGEIMQRVLELSPDWETTCKKSIPYFLHNKGRLRVTGWEHGPEIGAANIASSRPFYGDEIYPSIRLHHSRYHPTFYISYQPKHFYEGYITCHNIFQCVLQASGHYTLAHFSPLCYSEFKNAIDSIVTNNRLPNSYLVLNRYIKWINLPRRRIKKVGPLLALTLTLLSWFILRLFVMLRIPSFKKEHSQILVKELKRYRWIARRYRQILRVKNTFFFSK